MSRDLNDISFNTTVDTSSFRAEDFALFMDCLENIGTKNGSAIDKVKKTRKSRSRAHRPKDNEVTAALNKTTGCELGVKNWAPSYFSSCYSLNEVPAHNQSAMVDVTCSTIDQTINDEHDSSVIGDRFNLNEVFAYFNEDFDKTRFEDSDSADDGCKMADAKVGKENVAKPIPKEKPVRSARPKRVAHDVKNKTMLAPILSSSESERETATFKRPNALPLGRKIIAASRKPNATASTGNDAVDNRLNRTVNDAYVKQPQRYSSASTLSLHGSDSDSVEKRITAIDGEKTYVAPSVRDKISFFNQTFSERSTSPATQSAMSASSAPSASEDEEFQFQRQKSKRKFQQNREFFEKVFSKRVNSNEQNIERNTKAPKSQANSQEQKINKLEAVEAYVQTQYLLERIQLLVKAISKMDEAELEKIDLKQLKKFLLFIRDCSYNCQQVCSDISENFLTDFERNVMSAEELLFSALKAVHMPQKVVESSAGFFFYCLSAKCANFHLIHLIQLI